MFKKFIKLLKGEPRGYVSEADKLLDHLRKKYPQKSASQIAEIANAATIARLRDTPVKGEAVTSKLPKDF